MNPSPSLLLRFRNLIRSKIAETRRRKRGLRRGKLLIGSNGIWIGYMSNSGNQGVKNVLNIGTLKIHRTIGYFSVLMIVL
jgi:hypothetical protein